VGIVDLLKRLIRTEDPPAGRAGAEAAPPRSEEDTVELDPKCGESDELTTRS
jgi:hypothetical protein